MSFTKSNTLSATTFLFFDIIYHMRAQNLPHEGKRQSLRYLKYHPHLYIDCVKTLTALKYQPRWNTDRAGPKGQLV